MDDAGTRLPLRPAAAGRRLGAELAGPYARRKGPGLRMAEVTEPYAQRKLRALRLPERLPSRSGTRNQPDG
ncbi:hypothetical protein B5P43_13590 [Bacillus sp. SRB_336]|nr:hypothetical protein B5P43_13590 [Bacillus sp. SRB_336]